MSTVIRNLSRSESWMKPIGIINIDNLIRDNNIVDNEE